MNLFNSKLKATTKNSNNIPWIVCNKRFKTRNGMYLCDAKIMDTVSASHRYSNWGIVYVAKHNYVIKSFYWLPISTLKTLWSFLDKMVWPAIIHFWGGIPMWCGHRNVPVNHSKIARFFNSAKLPLEYLHHSRFYEGWLICNFCWLQ